ncbi:MAG: CDP-alcohol phosphatidyltransferase family protein [Deltaproteobacteria bacterium]|nr:CDP-alcohol phosphatidyltransferase family protein [Deltaproteobacteria bacterium]
MPQPKITLATWITISRFFLVPVFLWLFTVERYLLAVIAASIAGFTDFLDGFLARRLNMRSRLGSLLDPAADKFLMLLSLIVLTRLKMVPVWLTAVVIGRDLMITVGVIVLNLMKIRLYYKPTRFSKMTTFAQITVLVLSFLEVFIQKKIFEWPYGSPSFVGQLQYIFVYIAGVLTAITAGQYAYIGYKFYRFGERKG